MPALATEDVLGELRAMYRRRGRDGEIAPETELEQLGFRSLDFSELALRLEGRLGHELNFSAVPMRRAETVQDVVEFLQASAEA